MAFSLSTQKSIDAFLSLILFRIETQEKRVADKVLKYAPASKREIGLVEIIKKRNNVENEN